jgi:hypothetical protein
MKNQSRFWRYLLLMLAIAVVSGVSYVMAAEVWVGPGTNPPDGNRSRPIDTSSDFQVKAGSLRLQEGLYVGDYSYPSKSDDNFQLTSDGNLFLRGVAQIGSAAEDVTALSLSAHGAGDLSTAALFASNDGAGWSGYFTGAPVGIGSYLIVGGVPEDANPSGGYGYFAGNVYVGSNGGNSQLCLNGSAAANCISSFEDVGGGDLWQLNGADVYYSAGKVGIGTTTPQEQMEISSTGEGIARLRVTDVDFGENPEIQLQYNENSADHWGLYVSKVNTNNLQIWGGGADRVAIDQNGNVGINTLFPKAKLDVWGRVKAQQVLTDDFQVNDVNYASFNTSLWIGRQLGGISVCESAEGGCDNVLDLEGNTSITSSAVFNGRLFLGMDNGHLFSCDSGTACVDLGLKGLGSSINDMTIFANQLWLAMSAENKIYSCDASGVCSSHNTNANATYITAMKVYDGRLWLVSDAQLFVCSTTGACELKGSKGQGNFYSMAVYDGSLWLGNGVGKLWRCSPDGSCVEQAQNVGGSINKLTVFGDRLWLGLSNTKIYDLDLIGNYTEHNTVPAGQVKSMAVFNGYLWVGMSSGYLTYCKTDGSCAESYDLTPNSINTLVVYDYPSRSCNAFSRTFNQCLPIAADPISAILESEANYVRGTAVANTGVCHEGSVIIRKTNCGVQNPADPLSQDTYCGLKCPSGTKYASGGGCEVLDEFRSVNGKVQRYFNYGNSPKDFSDGTVGWECQLTRGHVLEVSVICIGNFGWLGQPFNPNPACTSPCNCSL